MIMYSYMSCKNSNGYNLKFIIDNNSGVILDDETGYIREGAFL